MNILCINTCLKESDVSVIKGESVFKATKYANIQHSLTLMNQIEEAMQKADLKTSELDFIAVCVGTGSFTGIRIGLAVAKGLANALNIPVIPVDTLTLLAYNSLNYCDYVVLKGVGEDLYVADVVSQQETKNMRLMCKQNFLNEISKTTKICTCDDLSDEFECDIEFIKNVEMGLLPLQLLKFAKESGEIEPIYLRLPQAEMQKRCNNDNKNN